MKCFAVTLHHQYTPMYMVFITKSNIWLKLIHQFHLLHYPYIVYKYTSLFIISTKSGRYTVFTLCACLCVRTLLNGQNHVLFAEKCIRLVHEKLRIFPYGQYIVGIYVSLAF